MPSTHSSLIFHVVFSTKEREVWFPPDFRPRLHAYLGGIIRNSGATAYAVGGPGDHVHHLIGLKPADVIPDLIRVLKAESSKWIKGMQSPSPYWDACPPGALLSGCGAFCPSRIPVRG